jgi:hypothetical protein
MARGIPRRMCSGVFVSFRYALGDLVVHGVDDDVEEGKDEREDDHVMWVMMMIMAMMLMMMMIIKGSVPPPCVQQVLRGAEPDDDLPVSSGHVQPRLRPSRLHKVRNALQCLSNGRSIRL